MYEVITYDRAIRLANGKYVVLMQDDDEFDNFHWIETGHKLMEEYPDMVILGGKDGRNIIFEGTNFKTSADAVPEGTEFCFVQAINRAPEWINKAVFMEDLVQIDQDFAPFQYDDYEICLRAWLLGLKVGWYDAGFRSLAAGGRRPYNNSFTAEQCERNGKRLSSKYWDKMDKIRSLVCAANEHLH